MDPVFYLLGAVVAGTVVQNVMTYRQATALTRAVSAMRTPGRTTSIGVGGRRYRGGRAYVAIAVDGSGAVVEALTLIGFSTLARPRPLPEVVGMTVARLERAGQKGRGVPGLKANQDIAVAQAAETLRQTLGRKAAAAATRTPDSSSDPRTETAV